jgi:hypothetical protein
MKRPNEFLEPAITPYADCHTCGQLVVLGSEHCVHCGIKLDQEDLLPSAVINFSLTQACSAANSIRSFDVAVVFFLACSLGSYLMEMPFWWLWIPMSLVWLLPLIVILRWFYRHGRWQLADPEYDAAKKEMRAGLKLWLAAHGFNALMIWLRLS